MKLSNGYGSVYKLSGNRRKPWVARKTTGWTFNQETEKSHPVYAFIGYYETRKEALTALADYNKDPYDLHNNTITFSEVYDLWSAEHFPTVSESNVRGYKASYKACEGLHDLKMVEIKLDHLQGVLDASGKNTPSLKKIKIMVGLMYDYCVRHEILPQEKRNMVRYLNVNKAGNPNRLNRQPFSKQEINRLWEMSDNEHIQICLFLIYTGVRIGEFYNLKKEDLHLKERWFQVTASKTKAGIREVPICEKIVPIIEHWQQKDSIYLFCNSEGNGFKDRGFRDSWWKPLMSDLGMSHRPHDTRHTCVFLLTASGVDSRVIKKIVGHKGQGVTEAVYTHPDLPVKLEAINKI